MKLVLVIALYPWILKYQYLPNLTLFVVIGRITCPTFVLLLLVTACIPRPLTLLCSHFQHWNFISTHCLACSSACTVGLLYLTEPGIGVYSQVLVSLVLWFLSRTRATPQSPVPQPSTLLLSLSFVSFPSQKYQSWQLGSHTLRRVFL